MEEELKRCDVLCIGGGIAGMMAAIKAAKDGAKSLPLNMSLVYK